MKQFMWWLALGSLCGIYSHKAALQECGPPSFLASQEHVLDKKENFKRGFFSLLPRETR